MDWSSLLTVILGNVGLIYLFRREIRDDQMNLENKLDMSIKHLDNRWYASMKSMEMDCKDFHERLLEIEKKRTK